MKFSQSVLAILAVVGVQITDAIYNGSYADGLSYMASIKVPDGRQFGASIISTRCVLTVATCTYNYNQFEVRYGSQWLDLSTVQTSIASITYPLYSNQNTEPNVGLVFVNIEFETNVTPIPISQRYLDGPIPAGQSFTVSGFGASAIAGASSEIVLARSTTVLADYYCLIFKSKQSTSCFSAATCKGDAGGPIVASDDEGWDEQVGVIVSEPWICNNVLNNVHVRFTRNLFDFVYPYTDLSILR